jgi:hypothetical protein
MTLHPPTLNDIIDFIVLSVIVRGIFAKWLAKLITKLFKKLIVSTEQEARLYIAYREKALKKGG